MLTANSTNVTYQITSSHPIVTVLPLSVTRDGLRYCIDITDRVHRADIKRFQNFLQKCATPDTWLWQHRRLPRAPYHPMRTPSCRDTSSNKNTRHLESSQTHKPTTLISHETSYIANPNPTHKFQEERKEEAPTWFSINYSEMQLKATSHTTLRARDHCT